MTRSFRLIAAALLWCVALLPLAVLGFGAMAPEAAVRTMQAGSRVAGWVTWGLAVAALAGIAIYPPLVPGLRLRLGRTWRQMGTSDAPVREAYARLRQLETVNDLFTVGRHLRERGDAAPAADLLRRAVAADPTHLGARYQLALALRDGGELQGAVDGLQAVLAADPLHAFGEPRLALAQILEASGLHLEAAMVLAEYRRLHGDQRPALLLHARALAGCGDREGSRTALRLAAAAPAAGERLRPEDALARGKARVALWFGGYR